MISDVALRISLLTRSVATALPALRDFNPLSSSSLQKFLVNCDVGFVVLSLASFSAKDRTRLLILSQSAAFDDGSAELRAVKCFNHSSAVGELFSPIGDEVSLVGHSGCHKGLRGFGFCKNAIFW